MSTEVITQATSMTVAQLTRMTGNDLNNGLIDVDLFHELSLAAAELSRNETDSARAEALRVAIWAAIMADESRTAFDYAIEFDLDEDTFEVLERHVERSLEIANTNGHEILSSILLESGIRMGPLGRSLDGSVQ